MLCPELLSLFESFEEMRQAYLQAVEDGDKETQEWLIELGESTLDKEIEFAASSSSSAIVPMADPDETYWSGQFPNFFSTEGGLIARRASRCRFILGMAGFGFCLMQTMRGIPCLQDSIGILIGQIPLQCRNSFSAIGVWRVG